MPSAVAVDQMKDKRLAVLVLLDSAAESSTFCVPDYIEDGANLAFKSQ